VFGFQQAGSINAGAQFFLPQAAEAQLPGNLPPGTPKVFWKPFAQGFSTAMKALEKNHCSDFYGKQGPDTLNNTEYRFLDLKSETVGAQTNSKSSVFINSTGPYMTYSPTIGRVGPFNRPWTQPQFRAFILLHELGHQLSSITGFKADAGPKLLGLNQDQSRQVIGACF
jgi:hypothetical protein